MFQNSFEFVILRLKAEGYILPCPPTGGAIAQNNSLLRNTE